MELKTLKKIILNQADKEKKNIALTWEETGKLKENTEKKFKKTNKNINPKNNNTENLLKDFIFKE